MKRFALALVPTLAVLAGCTTSYGDQSLPQQTAAAVTCGPPPALRPDPLHTGMALGLGPLWLRAGFSLGATTATTGGPLPDNSLTKVLIEHVTGTGTVRLTGASCAGGTPLRFCYDPCRARPNSGASTDVPSTLEVQIDLAESGDHTGYMLFTAPGRYRLSAEYGGHTLGSVVVAVPGGPFLPRA